MLFACGDNVPPPDDGFGNDCLVDLQSADLFTPCTSLLDLPGVCVQSVTEHPAGLCRRWCAGDETSPAACPQGQTAIPSTGGQGCFCQP